jgi:hypothetical protein
MRCLLEKDGIGGMKVDDVYWDFLRNRPIISTVPLHRLNPSPTARKRELTRFCAAKTEFINPTYPPLPLSAVLFTIKTRALILLLASVFSRIRPVADAWTFERFPEVEWVGWRRFMSGRKCQSG